MPDLRTFDNSVSTKSTERWCLTRCLHRWSAVNPCDANRYCTARSHSPSFWAKWASMTVRCSSSLARRLTAISRTSALNVWHRASNSQWKITTESYSLKPPTRCVRHSQTTWRIHCCVGIMSTQSFLIHFLCTLTAGLSRKLSRGLYDSGRLPRDERWTQIQFLTRGTRFPDPFHLGWLEATRREYPPIKFSRLQAAN
jgi:hypothetical protein